MNFVDIFCKLCYDIICWILMIVEGIKIIGMDDVYFYLGWICYANII